VAPKLQVKDLKAAAIDSIRDLLHLKQDLPIYILGVYEVLLNSCMRIDSQSAHVLSRGAVKPEAARVHQSRLASTDSSSARSSVHEQVQ
jgi:hypothetical protein